MYRYFNFGVSFHRVVRLVSVTGHLHRCYLICLRLDLYQLRSLTLVAQFEVELVQQQAISRAVACTLPCRNLLPSSCVQPRILVRVRFTVGASTLGLLVHEQVKGRQVVQVCRARRQLAVDFEGQILVIEPGAILAADQVGAVLVVDSSGIGLVVDRVAVFVVHFPDVLPGLLGLLRLLKWLREPWKLQRVDCRQRRRERARLSYKLSLQRMLTRNKYFPPRSDDFFLVSCFFRHLYLLSLLCMDRDYLYECGILANYRRSS